MAVIVREAQAAGRNRALAAYRHMSVETATPQELVLLLYNRALRSMREGEACIKERDFVGAHKNLVQAQDIVDELSASLDRNAGGEIARSLAAMYDYVNERLFRANIHKDPKPVAEALQVLGEIRDAWVEASRQYGKAR